MGESYELKFPINATGSEVLSEIDAAVAKIAGSASMSGAELKSFEAILRSITATGQTLTEALTSIAASEKTLGASIANTAKEMLHEAEAAAAAGAAVGGLGSAHRKAITDIQATGGAIRAFEGSLSIRAVEQFATKILGLGPLFQTIFPVVGAIAVVELLGTMVGKVVELYHEWDPVCQAEQRSLDILKETGKELDNLKTKERSLVLASVERAEGRGGALLYQAGIQDTAAIRAGQDVNLNEGRLAEAQRRLAAGNISGHMNASGTFVPGYLTTDAQVAQKEIPALKQQIEDARQRQLVATQQANEYRAQKDDLDKAETKKESDAARRKSEQAANALAAFNSSVEDAGLTPIQREIKKANAVGGDPRSVLFGANVMDGLGSGWSLGNAQSDAQRLHPGTSMGMVGRLAGPLSQIKLDDSGDKDSASRLAGDTKLFQEGLKKAISDDDGAVKVLLDSLKRLDSISNEHEVRMLQIQLGESESSIRTIAEKRLEGAKDDYGAQKILYDAEEQIAELHKRQADDLQAQADRLASDLFNGMMGGGKGMTSFLENLLKQQGGQIFTNVASGYLKSGIQELGKLGGESGFGKYLGGTLFDHKDAAVVTSTDLNTAATVANTAVLSRVGFGGGGSGSGWSGGGAQWVGNGAAYGTDDYGNPTFGNPVYSPDGSTSSGAMSFLSSPKFAKSLASAAAIGAGAFAAYDGFSRGGARGVTEGVGGLAGMAGGIVSLAGVTGPLAPIMAGVGMALGVITSLFGDPKQIRENQINKEIRDALYMAPPSVDVQSDITGARTRTNRAGQIDSTPWDAFAFRVNDPYYIRGPHDSSNLEQVPGTVTYNYITIPVNAADAKSFIDQRNNIAAAVHQAMQEGHPINYQVQSLNGH
jgi:hypothetical protein